MTQINEKGQMYFTFEELDFEGAYSLLRKEIDGNGFVLDALVEKIISLESGDFKEELYGWYDELSKQNKKMLMVWKYVRRLKNGGDFLGKDL